MRQPLRTCRSRARGLAPWKPEAATLAVVDDVKAVLSEYRAHLPLTLRQVFYRLVATRDFEKTERSYKRLGEILNRARRAGFVRFEDIRDDGVVVARPKAWGDANDFRLAVIDSAESFKLDRQDGQSIRLFIAVEATGMVPQVARIANEFGVSVQSSGGFDSLTAKHDLARLLARWPDSEVLHIGDYDPSGEHVFQSLKSDLNAFLVDFGAQATSSGTRRRFTRLAVTPLQIEKYRLPTAFPKATDRRQFADTRTVQAEAFAPDLLQELIREAILERIDRAIYADTLRREREQRESLIEHFSTEAP